MKKIREIIRRDEQAGMSQRQIAQATGVSRPVVAQTIGKARASALTIEAARKMSDGELAEFFSDPKKIMRKADFLAKNFPSFTKELKKTAVTLQLLWEEYRRENPSGLYYIQFCFHYRKCREEAKFSRHNEHKPGDKMFIGYTGISSAITDFSFRTIASPRSSAARSTCLKPTWRAARCSIIRLLSLKLSTLAVWLM